MRSRGIILLTLLFISSMAIVILLVSKKTDPKEEMLQASKKLSEARLEKAPKYAEGLFGIALNYYDSSLAEWQHQNSRFILFRDYERSVQLARESCIFSEKSIQRARLNLSKEEGSLDEKIVAVGQAIVSFDDRFGRFPLRYEHWDKIAKCRIQYTEAKIAYKNGKYAEARTKLEKAETTILQISGYYEELLRKYLEGFPAWNSMVNQGIAGSKSGKNYVVIVDKLDRNLWIYKDGKVARQFSIELGSNWIGDKVQQGDKTTPEGIYKIVEKKQNGHTRFYKACLLNYPNKEDQKRFEENKKSGMLDEHAKIGNLIEIHGQGGKGVDWTNGCIALNDRDMDVLFKLCPVGTKVIIVGSTKSYNEISSQ